MSSMSKQVKDLRNLEILVAQLQDKDIAMLLRDAEDTIETFVTHSDKPKQGEWIRHENPRYFYDREQGDTNAGVYYTCSECNYISLTHNFCPNCGSYNGGKQK